MGLFVNWMSRSGISERRDSLVCAGCEGERAAVVGQRHQSRRRSSWRGDGKPFEWLRRPLNPSRAVTSGGRHSREPPSQPAAVRSEVDQGKLDDETSPEGELNPANVCIYCSRKWNGWVRISVNNYRTASLQNKL